jgi:hypothetical protein
LTAAVETPEAVLQNGTSSNAAMNGHAICRNTSLDIQHCHGMAKREGPEDEVFALQRQIGRRRSGGVYGGTCIGRDL